MAVRILYIDDDEQEREGLAAALRQRELEVETASTGREGLDRLTGTSIDVILCDLNMPEMDGLDVLDATRQLCPDTPFVLLTSHPTVARAKKAVTRGAYRFLIKPVHVDEIEITVQLAIEHARLQRWKNEAEEQLRHIVEMTPVPMMMSRAEDGTILYANRHFAQLLASDPESLRGRSTKEFEAAGQDRSTIVETLMNHGVVTDAELEARRDDGEHIWLLYSLVKTQVGGEQVFLGGFHDITRRKQAEERLRVFQAVFDQSIDVIVIWDAENRVVARNAAHELRTGFTDDEFLGQHAADILGQRQVDEIRSHLDDKGHYRGEFNVMAKSGQRVPVDLSIFPLLDSEGKTERVVSVGRDQSEVKRALAELAKTNEELRHTQAQLVQSEKMASLGSLVAGIAHEINTPVGAVGSMHQTLVRAIDKLLEHIKNKQGESFDTDPKVARLLEVIHNANDVIHSGTDRVREIVRRLRSFARLDEAELKKVDIHEGLGDTLSLIHHEIKHYIEIDEHLGELPEIAVYPSRLNQVFLNLLNNARQAIEGKGRITIETKQDGDFVEVRITDSGKGIAPEDLTRIFDPGFTTKGAGVGTGLGLSICYQIVRDHHGSLEAVSEPGHGATFILRLPTNLDQILEVS